MKKAVSLGMPAVAMTDHGNMFGAIEFYQSAQDHGIKPIIGCEVYLAPGSMTDHSASSARDASSHFTLLAQDETGYHNLVKLVSAGFLDGFYYKPRIDKQLLAQHSNGLIGMSACLKGEINLAIQQDDLKKARQSVDDFANIFGKDRFFLELHDHGIEAQRKCNRELIRLSKDAGLGLVAANDVHFLERSHHDAHDVMICIGTGAMVHDEKRMRYSPELYFKTHEEMVALFHETPDAIINTMRIAEMCDLEINFKNARYPEYTPPDGMTRAEYLRDLCYAGLIERYGPDAPTKTELTERLDYELSVIEKTGFISYFLIVWDFIAYARRKGVPVGPGRGSAAGSLIAYVLRITDIDPLEYGLIFERFLNPDRVSAPDVDIDFCVNRRGEVIEYVRQKYGERAVAQIVTFGTMGAKSVIRDVGRVMGLSYGDADRIARMIPNEIGITLNGKDKDGKHEPGAIDKNPDLKKAVETEPATQQLWNYATLLEGLSRNTGMHAAGVVISDNDLSDQIPLCRGTDKEVMTQYAMGPLTSLGMLKMDFLGLKNLTVMEDTVQLIRKTEPDFCLEKIPIDNQEAFAVINRGDTIGLFQLESGGITAICKQIDVQNIGDIIALIALYRPGPMDLLPDYISRKKGKTKIKYEHPLLKEISEDTFGVLIYQEQVQRAANVLAGFTLAEADLLRRAMGKKDKEKMAKERERFINGCAKVNQIPSDRANAIFDLLEKFAGYGFNKSHSAAYGLVCYRTAYLKANYPVEFMCGLLSNEINNTDKIAVLVAECKRMRIPILPPDLNRSGLKFSAEDAGADQRAIRFGLAGVKNVGEAAMAATIKERECNGMFNGLEDFCSRLDGRTVNRKIVESLIKCGAFDFTGRDRAELFARVESTLASAASAQRDRASGQVSLFDDVELQSAPPTTVESAAYEPWTREEKLAQEKELLGFYVTGHPLDNYFDVFARKGFTPIASLGDVEDKSNVTVAGILSSVERKFTKSEGKPFAILQLEDLSASMEIIVWTETYNKVQDRLQPGKVVAVTGKLGTRDDSLRLSASDVQPVKPDKASAPLRLVFSADAGTMEQMLDIREKLLRHPGAQPVVFEFQRVGETPVRVAAGEAFCIELDDELRQDLSHWIAE